MKQLGWDGIGLGGIPCTWPRKDGVGFLIEIHRRWVGWDNTLEKNRCDAIRCIVMGLGRMAMAMVMVMAVGVVMAMAVVVAVAVAMAMAMAMAMT